VGRVVEEWCGVVYTHRVNGGTYKRKDALRLEGRLYVIKGTIKFRSENTQCGQYKLPSRQPRRGI